MAKYSDFNFSDDGGGPDTDPTLDDYEFLSQLIRDNTNYDEPGEGEAFSGQEPTFWDGNADPDYVGPTSDEIPPVLEDDSDHYEVLEKMRELGYVPGTDEYLWRVLRYELEAEVDQAEREELKRLQYDVREDIEPTVDILDFLLAEVNKKEEDDLRNLQYDLREQYLPMRSYADIIDELIRNDTPLQISPDEEDEAAQEEFERRSAAAILGWQTRRANQARFRAMQNDLRDQLEPELTDDEALLLLESYRQRSEAQEDEDYFRPFVQDQLRETEFFVPILAMNESIDFFMDTEDAYDSLEDFSYTPGTVDIMTYLGDIDLDSFIEEFNFYDATIEDDM